MGTKKVIALDKLTREPLARFKSIGEAAEFLNIHRNSVYNQLKTLGAGREHRFLLTREENFLETRKMDITYRDGCPVCATNTKTNERLYFYCARDAKNYFEMKDMRTVHSYLNFSTKSLYKGVWRLRWHGHRVDKCRAIRILDDTIGVPYFISIEGDNK